MRPGPLAVLSLVSAAVGAALVLVVLVASGRLDAGGPGGTTTLVLGAEEQERPREELTAAAARRALDFDPARLYEERSGGVVTIYARFSGDDTAGSQGSGFVASADGHVLTNAHVITTAGEGDGRVRAAREVFVEFRDGERVTGRIVGWDVFADVGVVKVDPEAAPLRPLPLGRSAAVVVGEPVAAIGSPFGEQTSLSVGVVSATRRSIAALTSGYRLIDAIQTDAPINRGNSGGPLFDGAGRVIGINAQIRSASGTNEGVGFAVPIDSARRSLAQIVATGRVAYAYVGITTDDLTPALARRLGSRVQRGAVVVEVNDGPARRAGLRGGTRTIELAGREHSIGGDIVLAIDGLEVASGDDLVRIVTNILAPGDVTTFTVLRRGRRVEVPVTLGERPAQPPR